MRCPICKTRIPDGGNPYRPFCSERCQWLDLDNWLSERYRISTPLESVEKTREAEEAAARSGSGSTLGSGVLEPGRAAPRVKGERG